MGHLEGPQLADQRVVLRVGHLRLVEHVIAMVVVANLFMQLGNPAALSVRHRGLPRAHHGAKR